MDRTKQEQEFFEWAEQLTERLNNPTQPQKTKQPEPPPLLKTEEDTF